jgi:hypothetical protein
VSYLSPELAGYSVDPEISRGVRKLVWTPEQPGYKTKKKISILHPTLGSLELNSCLTIECLTHNLSPTAGHILGLNLT